MVSFSSLQWYLEISLCCISHTLFISIASGQVGRTLNPALSQNGYFYVLVTSASSDPANTASVAAPQEWAEQAFAVCWTLQAVLGCPASGHEVSLGLMMHTSQLLPLKSQQNRESSEMQELVSSRHCWVVLVFGRSASGVQLNFKETATVEHTQSSYPSSKGWLPWTGRTQRCSQCNKTQLTGSRELWL